MCIICTRNFQRRGLSKKPNISTNCYTHHSYLTTCDTSLKPSNGEESVTHVIWLTISLIYPPKNKNCTLFFFSDQIGHTTQPLPMTHVKQPWPYSVISHRHNSYAFYGKLLRTETWRAFVDPLTNCRKPNRVGSSHKPLNRN